MRPANLRAAALLPLLLACLAASSCTAVTQPTTPPTPSPREQALIDILSAQSYAAEIANLAGTAVATGTIAEDSYGAIKASGTALDVAWRDAARALMDDASNLQEKVDVMAEKKRNLEKVWKQQGPQEGDEQ